MAIEGFEYKQFAEIMATQAAELAPADLKDLEKEYLVNTLKILQCLPAKR